MNLRYYYVAVLFLNCLSAVVEVAADDDGARRGQVRTSVRVCAEDGKPAWPAIQVYSDEENNETVVLSDLDVSFTDLNCRLSFISHGYYLFPNGSVVETLYTNEALQEDSYCFLSTLEDNHTFPGVLVCFPASPFTPLEITFMVGFVVSDISILLTLVVYLLVPKLVSNTHGKNLVCHCISLFCTYLLYALSYAGEKNLPGIVTSDAECTIISYLLHYFWLSSLMWLTVISFDIFRNFRDIVPITPSDWSRFHMYNLAGWGAPLLPVLLSFVADHADWSVKPYHAVQHCFINDSSAKLVFVYIPLSVIVFVNLVFFCLTACSIYKVKKQTAQVLAESHSRRISNSRPQVWTEFMLYMKLFLIMGLTWVMEVISWVCQEQYNVSAEYFVLTDVVNSLQGLFILTVTVSNKDTLKLTLGKIKRHIVRASTSRGGTLPTNVRSITDGDDGGKIAAVTRL